MGGGGERGGRNFIIPLPFFLQFNMVKYWVLWLETVIKIKACVFCKLVLYQVSVVKKVLTALFAHAALVNPDVTGQVTVLEIHIRVQWLKVLGNAHGCSVMCMGARQCVWVLGDVYGCSAMRMSARRCVWVLGNAYGCSAMCMGARRCVWVLCDVYGCSAMRMGARRCVWVLGDASGCSAMRLGARRCVWVLGNVSGAR